MSLISSFLASLFIICASPCIYQGMGKNLTMSYWILLKLTGSFQVQLTLTGYKRLLPGLISLNISYQVVLMGLTGSYQVSLDLTGSYQLVMGQKQTFFYHFSIPEAPKLISTIIFGRFCLIFFLLLFNMC